MKAWLKKRWFEIWMIFVVLMFLLLAVVEGISIIKSNRLVWEAKQRRLEAYDAKD